MQTDGELIRQARRLFEAGDFDGAERAYRQLVEELPEAQRPDAQLVVAACQQAQGRRDEAIESIQAAIGMDESHAESWFQLGRARRQSGDEDGASEALEKALELNPNHALARVERARQALARGDTEGAEAQLRTALRADPDCVPALVAMAERQVDAGQLDRAQEMAAHAVQLRPDNVPGQLVMARVFRRRGHPDFAQRCLENALRIVPGSAELHTAMARLLLERGRTREALKQAGEARDHGAADHRVALIEAQGWRQLGRPGEARRRLEELPDSQRADVDVLVLLAELQLGEGDLPGVNATIDRLEQVSAPAAQLLRAQLAERQGDVARAAEMAAVLHDDANPQIQQQARLLSARLALDGDKPEVCIDALQPLAAAGAVDPLVHWMLARSLDQAGRYEEAAGHLDRTGWRSPALLRSRERELPDALYDALESLDVSAWDTKAPDDGRPQPVFVLGWPGSGRDQLLAALAEQGAFRVLGREDARRRRDALNLPAWPERLSEADDTRRRLVRKRYLREAGSEADRLLETMWLPFAALPAIARYFPGATVILADADLRDLELDWRLAGLSGVETLRALWQREQTVLEKLLEVLPLDFIVFSRADLESDVGDVAAQLSGPLGLSDSAGLAAAIERSLGSLKPTGYWKHYEKLFESKSVA